MLAKLLQADVDPSRLDEAAQAVQQELIPLFVAHPGARQGYWMANRVTGQVLVMTCWADLDALEAASAADGEERARVAERIGIRLRAVQTLDVLGVTELHAGDHPVLRYARATWVEGLSPDRDTSLRAMHGEIVPMQARSPAFCASYWLADYVAGTGLGLTLWSRIEELHDDEVDTKARREWFEETVGCKIDLVSELEALGVVVPTTHDTINLAEPAASVYE